MTRKKIAIKPHSYQFKSVPHLITVIFAKSLIRAAIIGEIAYFTYYTFIGTPVITFFDTLLYFTCGHVLSRRRISFCNEIDTYLVISTTIFWTVMLHLLIANATKKLQYSSIISTKKLIAFTVLVHMILIGVHYFRGTPSEEISILQILVGLVLQSAVILGYQYLKDNIRSFKPTYHQ